ncbi:MAG: HEAT repeat domain-containing protein, partial [Planctomycetota bacterium]
MDKAAKSILCALWLIVRCSAFAVWAWASLAEEPPAQPRATIPEPKPITQIMGKNVQGWIAYLKQHENEQERKLAMFCLVDFGPAAAEAVPELLELCKDELQTDTPRWAAETLGSIGPAAKDAVAVLLGMLNNQALPEAQRAAACAALARIDPEAAPVRKAILNAFRDPRPEVRAAAIDAAVTLAPGDSAALEALSKALYNETDAGAAAAALRCLEKEGQDVLAKAVERGEAATRAAAAEALSRMGSAAAGTVPALLKAAKREKQAEARARLLLAAARLAPKDAAVLEALVERIASGEAGTAPLTGAAAGRSSGSPLVAGATIDDARIGAAEASLLAAAGPDAVPALRAGLRAPAAAARLQIVNILAKLPQPGADAVGDVLARTQDKDREVRLAALGALSGFGPAAAQTREALAELGRQDPTVQRAAELAALNVSRAPQQARYRSVLEARPDDAVLAALKDPHPEVRREAAESLRTRTADAGRTAGALIDALRDEKPEVRVAASYSLVRFGKYARVAMSTFTEWLEAAARAAKPHASAEELTADEQKAMALPKAALAVLAGMGAEAKPALPALVSTALSPLPENDAELRDLLGAGLRLIGPDAAPDLIKELRSPDVERRRRAAQALASMGPVAATAAPDLIELSKSAVDSDAWSGFAGLQALGPAVYDVAAAYL